MASWQRRPDGLVAWLVLAVAVFIFTPVLFSSQSVTQESVWLRVLRDVPLAALFVALIAHDGASRRWRELLAGLRGALSPRRLLRVLARGGAREEVLAALAVVLAAFAGFFAFSALAVQAPSLGTVASARYYVGYPLLAIAVALAGPLRVRPFAVAIVALAALQTVLAVLDYFSLFGFTFYFGQVQFAGYLYPRAIGTLGNPNNLGIYLAFALIIVLSSGEHATRRGRSAIGAIVVGLVLTVSRTAPLALLIAYAGTVWRRRGTRNGKLGIGFAILAMLALSVAAASRIGRAGGLNGVFGSRGDTARNAMADWMETPWTFAFGRGFAAQTTVGPGDAIQETVIDNMALAVAVEGGLAGLVLLTLVVWLGVRMVLLAPAAAPLGAVARRYALFFCAYVPIAVNFRLFPGALFFWVLAGLCAGAATRPAQPRPAREPARGSERPLQESLP